MDVLHGLGQWFQTNGVTLMAIVWTIDQLLKLIAPLTKSKLDDNLSDLLGKTLAKYLPKPK